MQLVSMELSGFKPLTTTGYNYLLFTPKELVQVILGTNGSGKTMLLRQIVPRAAERAMFRPDGFMRAVYLHNNRTYVLTYDAKSNTHRFMCELDGVQTHLNEGGTSRVQEELIVQEFGLTPLLRQLVDGSLRFSQLSPPKRRELFTLMSPTPFDYVLEFYERAKRELNTAQAYSRRLKKQLVEEQARVIEPAQYEQLQKQNYALDNKLQALYAERAPIERSSQELAHEHDKTLERIRLTSEQVLRDKTQAPPGVNVDSLEQLEQLIAHEREQMAVIQSRLADRASEHEKLNEQVQAASAGAGVDIPALELALHALQAKRQTYIEQLRSALPEQYVQLAGGFDEQAQQTLLEVFQELPANDEGQYSNAALKELERRLEALKEHHVQLRQQISHGEGALAHQERHRQQDAVTCPQCTHSFVAGFDQAYYERLQGDLTQAREQAAQLQAQITALETERGELLTFFDRYRLFLNIRAQYRQYESLWQLLEQDQTAFRYPRMALQYVERFIHDTQIYRSIVELDRSIERDQALLDVSRNVNQSRLQQDRAKLEQLQAQISELSADSSAKQRLLYELNTYLQRMRDLTVHAARVLEQDWQLAQQTWYEQVRTLRQELIHELIRQTQSELAGNQERLQAADNQLGVIEHLTHQIDALELEIQAWQITVTEVSPSAGLIAESMMEYVNDVIKSANEIIAWNWTYPLVIRQCDFDESGDAGLSYRFPVDIDEGANSIRDVSEGSKAQREVIDLAIRIVGMVYTGLGTGMLMLDEFGDGFDPKHKANSVHTVNKLIEQMDFAQVFMVSHSVTSFGALKNNDITLLSDRNIKVDGAYNQCVIMR